MSGQTTGKLQSIILTVVSTASYLLCPSLSAVHAVVMYLSICLSVCVRVCVSVTLQYCVKMANHRITQIMPHDRPGTSFQMGCFVVAEFLLTSASCGPSAIAEPLVVIIWAISLDEHLLF